MHVLQFTSEDQSMTHMKDQLEYYLKVLFYSLLWFWLTRVAFADILLCVWMVLMYVRTQRHLGENNDETEHYRV